MKAIDSFADFALNDLRQRTDDEYQLDVAVKSTVVAYYTMPLSLMAVSAVLAWLLPGWLSVLAILPYTTLLVAEFVAYAWHLPRAPRPRSSVAPLYSVAIIALLLVLLAGIAKQLIGAGEMSSGIGMLMGALSGAAVAGILGPRVWHAARKRDVQRLEAGLED